MNERIRELAEQAKNDLVTEIHSKATGMDINIVKIIVLGSKLKDDYAQDFSTKFAELIVQECVGIVEQYGTPDAFYIVDEINRVMLNIRPNKHFGVEE